MPELDDIQIDRPERGPEDRDPPRRQRSTVLWLLVAVLIALAAVGGYLFYQFRQPAVEPVEEVTAPPRAAEPVDEDAEEEASEELELPPLEASDEIVRRVVQTLSEHPALSSWLATDQLVRRFVLAVDNVAVGISPREQLPSMAPDEEFTVTERQGGTVRADPAAHRRYDRVAAVTASIDAAGAVETYERLRPLVEEASAELGYGAGGFDQRLVEAILHLLRTPVPESSPELEREVMSYHYADPRLESLSDAQKQLLRMGPDNQRLVQRKLREIALELGVPPERLPDERILQDP